MEQVNGASIDLTTAWTEVEASSIMRFFSIYTVSGNINIQYYTNSGWSSSIQKDAEEIYQNRLDVKKFRVAAQTSAATINYSYQEETLQINAQAEKSNPVDTDVIILEDSADSKKQKKVNLLNFLNLNFLRLNTTNNPLTADLTVIGRVKEEGTFAEIYVADGSTPQSIPTGITYTKLTVFTNNGLSSNCTSDVANDKITITKTGIYKVNFVLNSMSGTNNVTFKAVAFLNGVEQHQVHDIRKLSVANDAGSSSGCGFIDVTSASLDLDLRIRHDNAGSVNYTPVYANLNVVYIGET